MFSGCKNLTDLRLFKINLNKVEVVDYMFSECKKELKEKVKKLYKNMKEIAFLDKK